MVSALDTLLPKLHSIKRVVVFTGAGISRGSGIPTFRDSDGLWKRYNPRDLATQEAFQKNPQLVWEWYLFRRKIVEEADPNPAHIGVKEMETLFPSVTIITQNVDDLHERAGSREVLHLHGSLFQYKCEKEHHPATLLPPIPFSPPLCNFCNSLIRPDVVWFGEPLSEAILKKAIELSQSCELFITIGSSLTVYPAGELPFLALQRGAIVIEINPHPTPLTPYATLSLLGKAEEIVPELLKRIREWKEKEKDLSSRQ